MLAGDDSVVPGREDALPAAAEDLLDGARDLAFGHRESPSATFSVALKPMPAALLE
jgi:hypothetical protein